MDMNLVVKRLDKDSLDSQIEVFRTAFENGSDIDTLKDYWKKKHYMNPVHESYVFGVYDEDRLVSINAFMPMRYSYNTKVFNVVQTCESGTLPEYRGKGLWSKVVTFAMDFFRESGEYDFFIGFPNYRNAFGGFKKMNWVHECDVANYIFLVNGKTFLNAVVGKSLPFSKLLELQKLFIGKKQKGYNLSDYPIANNIETTKGFNIDLTEDFLKWKKDYKNVDSFGIEKNNRYIGRCTYALGKYNGVSIILLCRVDAENEKDLNDVYSISIREIINKYPNAAFIRTWAIPNSIKENAIKRLGFIKSRHPNPFMTYQLKNDAVDSAELHLTSNWCNLSLLDLD